MTNKEIGNRIREARENLGLTKKEVANRIKMADSTIKRYEDGEIEKIKLPVIESIAKVLNVNPMWIIGKTDTQKTKHEDNTFEISELEKNILISFRKADEFDKISILRTLNIGSENEEIELLAAHAKENATPSEINKDIELIKNLKSKINK